jgi:2-polyprenyl-3-methyl-5-hydroxy-6-metoxy-1,4-benzoquinol methylase
MKALRRTFYDLRTEGQGRAREACAIAVGLFIGCLPFYGFHLLLCWLVGRLLGLNRLKVYLAANVSNPIVAPLLVFVELQAGAWLRTGSFLALTLETARTITPWQFGAHLLVGSVAVGGVLAAIGGVATYVALGGGAHDPFFDSLARAAADRYATTSITAWEFARGKLRGDPVYREVLLGGWLPSGGRLLDIGCGQGLMLALLAEAERFERSASATPGRLPCFERLVGVELRAHRARLARAALGSDAEIVESDARTLSAGTARVVLLFDVLHMMPRPDQDALLAAAVRALEPGGMIVVREADASAGWRFQAVRFGNRLTALASGAWHQTFAFRTLEEWRDCFSRHGLDVEGAPAGAGTPFANHLFRLRASSAAAARAG